MRGERFRVAGVTRLWATLAMFRGEKEEVLDLVIEQETDCLPGHIGLEPP